jgi:hypothetical protein
MTAFGAERKLGREIVASGFAPTAVAWCQRPGRRKISENPVNRSATFWMARCWACWEIATTRGIVIGAGPAQTPRLLN